MSTSILKAISYAGVYSYTGVYIKAITIAEYATI